MRDGKVGQQSCVPASSINTFALLYLIILLNMSKAMSASLIMGVTLGTIGFCILVATLAICFRRHQQRRRSAKLHSLPLPVTASYRAVAKLSIPPMPYIQSPSTGPSSPVESPIVGTATVFQLRNVNGSTPDFSVVLRDEGAVARPLSAVVRASPPLYPGHVPYRSPRAVG